MKTSNLEPKFLLLAFHLEFIWMLFPATSSDCSAVETMCLHALCTVLSSVLLFSSVITRASEGNHDQLLRKKLVEYNSEVFNTICAHYSIVKKIQNRQLAVCRQMYQHMDHLVSSIFNNSCTRRWKTRSPFSLLYHAGFDKC